MTTPSPIVFRIITRAEMRAGLESVGRPFSEDETVFLSSLPPMEPPTADQLEDMMRRREARIDGCVRQRSESVFPQNSHDA